MPGNIPYIIEADLGPIIGQPQAWDQGLYQVGSDLWAFIATTPVPTGDPNLNAYKSSDGLAGQAWTQQGTGPTCGTLGAGTGASFVREGGVVYAAYANAADLSLNLTDFTFAGITWSAPITGGPVIGNAPGRTATNPLLQRTSGGDSLILYYDGTNTKIVVYSAGWGTPVVIGSGERLKSAVIDSSDRLHIITWNGAALRYRTFIAGVLSAATTAHTPSNSINEMGPGTYNSGTDEIVFPLLEALPGPLGIQISLLRGTPSSAVAWTQDIADASGAFDSFFYPKYFKVGSSEYAFCMVEVGSGTVHEQIGFYKKTAGVWGPRVTFWDELANPGVPPQTTIDDITIWSALVLDDGVTLGATIGLFPDNPYACAVQYALIGPLETVAAPAITIDATLGASFIFNPGGGNAPIDSAIHTVCTINTATAGTLADTPHIVRKYAFNHEPFPQDIIYFTPWSDLGWQYQKVARNLLLDIDTGGIAASVQLQTDGGAAQTFSVTTTSNDRDRVFATNSDLEGKLWRLTLAPGTDGKTQLFKASLDFIPDCNILTYADSLEQNFGYPSWKYIKEVWVFYKGGPLTITILVDGGFTFYTHTLPAVTTRSVERFYLPAANSGVLNKSKKYRIRMSAPLGFRLYAGSMMEWYGFSADELGSFSLMQIHPEMMQNIGQQTTAAWSL